MPRVRNSVLPEVAGVVYRHEKNQRVMPRRHRRGTSSREIKKTPASTLPLEGNSVELSRCKRMKRLATPVRQRLVGLPEKICLRSTALNELS